MPQRAAFRRQCLLLAGMLAVALGAEEGPWGLQVHGFTSVGYLLTTDNEWLAEDSTDGTTELWAFAVNAVARPADGWRLGAQVYARDLGIYDNGRVQLDYLYADWRVRDEIGIQFGRVRTFGGLYADSFEVDSARVPVFLPESIYPLRTRDFAVNVDGVKIYGFFPDIGIGSLEYGLVGGAKRFDDEGSTADLFRARGFYDDLEIDTNGLVAGMVQWNQPLPGLTLRLAGGHLFDLEIHSDAGSGDRLDLVDTDWPYLLVGAEFEMGDWIIASEYGRQFADGEIRGRSAGPFPPDFSVPFENDTEGIYLNASWEPPGPLALYAGIDAIATRAGHYDGDQRTVRYAAAARYAILERWLVKGEVRLVDGTQGVIGGEGGSDPADTWWTFALKTTVDF